MTYLSHLESAAALMNTIALHRDDAVRSIERLKYQGGHSGNGVDFSNVQAAMRAIKSAAQEATNLVALAQEANLIEHAKEGQPFELTPAGYRALGEAAAEDAKLVAFPSRLRCVPGALDGDGGDAA